MKIDYLTLRLTGSQGIVASFVPAGQDVETTPEGGETGLCWCVRVWEGQGLITTDAIPWHATQLARTWSHSGAREKNIL